MHHKQTDVPPLLSGAGLRAGSPWQAREPPRQRAASVLGQRPGVRVPGGVEGAHPAQHRHGSYRSWEAVAERPQRVPQWQAQGRMPVDGVVQESDRAEDRYRTVPASVGLLVARGFLRCRRDGLQPSGYRCNRAAVILKALVPLTD